MKTLIINPKDVVPYLNSLLKISKQHAIWCQPSLQMQFMQKLIILVPLISLSFGGKLKYPDPEIFENTFKNLTKDQTNC